MTGSRAARLQADLDRAREHGGVEDVGELGEFLARALERHLRRDVVHLPHFGEGVDVTERRRDRFDRRPLGDEGADLDVLLEAAQRPADVQRDEAEEADGEHAEGDRDDAERAEQRRAADAEHDLAKGESHQVAASGAGGGVAPESKTSWPRLSSITR